MDTLLEKLEALKQKGSYSVTLNFGEGEGADDSDTPVDERSCVVTCKPVGYLGSVKAMYKGTVKGFLELDLNTEPKLISNPPQKEEYENPGFYYWGTEGSVENIKEQGKVFMA